MESSVQERPRKRRSRSLLLIQLVIVAGFLAVLWFSFGQTVLAPAKQRVLPERLGHLEFVSMVQGQQAIERVARLHGMDIALVNAYIGQYGHQGEEATLWVGQAGSARDGEELLKRMIAGISKGGSPFHNLKQINIDGQEVYQVEGPGGQHLFYNSAQSGEKVVWLSVTGTDAASLIKQTVKMF